MTELERYKKALDVAIGELSNKARHTYIDADSCEESSAKALTSIKFILYPLPETVEIEVERFLVFYLDGSVSHALTREGLQGYDCRGGFVERVARKIERPKPQPVEKFAHGQVSGRDGMVPTVYVTIPAGDVPPMDARVSVHWSEPV